MKIQISKPEAIRQVNRLSVLPRFGELGEFGMAEFVRVVREGAETDEHAERAVTAWLNSNKWLPTPAELLELLATLPGRQIVPPNYGCVTCKGSGFEPVHVLVTYIRHPNGEAKNCEERVITAEVAGQLASKVDGVSQVVTTGCRPCGCSYGRHLYRARAAKETESEEKRHRGSKKVS
jgi:hypothetical protein